MNNLLITKENKKTKRFILSSVIRSPIHFNPDNNYINYSFLPLVISVLCA